MTDKRREAARLAGQKFYHGLACKHEGHGSKRYTTSGSCYACCRIRDSKAVTKRQVTISENRATGFTWPVFIIGNPDRVRGKGG